MRFHADDIPYSSRHIGSFRGWRRRGRVRHHLAVESGAVFDYRRNRGFAYVLRRVKYFFQAKNYFFSKKEIFGKIIENYCFLFKNIVYLEANQTNLTE